MHTRIPVHRAKQTAGPSRIAVCSWSLRPESPAHLIDRLRRLNISAVQLALTPLIDQPEMWGGAVAQLRGAGIQIVSGMMAMAGEDYSTLESIARTGGVRPDATWPANRLHAQRVAEAAADAGLELVTFHAGFIPHDIPERDTHHESNDERRVLLDRLRAVADIFAAHRIHLALETGQETAATLAAALDELDRPNVGVNFDPANMILYGMGEPVEALRALACRVRQVHVKDAQPARTPGEWGTEVPAGIGAVNWPAFFEIALAIRPPVNFVIERESRSGTENDLIAARDLIAYHL